MRAGSFQSARRHFGFAFRMRSPLTFAIKLNQQLLIQRYLDNLGRFDISDFVTCVARANDVLSSHSSHRHFNLLETLQLGTR